MLSKRIIKGIIVLTMCIVVAVASMGASCQMELDVKNGHWVTNTRPDGTTYKTCEQGGSQCVIATASVKN